MTRQQWRNFVASMALAVVLCSVPGVRANGSPATPQQEESSVSPDTQPTEVATFGAGCFWCVEAVFEELRGVISVESGYSGGSIANPTYEQVCSGTTGHAEVCRITFDPSVISYKELLEVFWKTHDPTTLNRQGGDEGTQYRSVIFFHSDEQRQLAETYKLRLDESGAFSAPIVTEIIPAAEFYSAEDYHQEYFRNNPNQGYCRAVVRPKVEKFRQAFSEKLKQH
jgi:peptide-methionine (S)-S-oxide reductase